MKIGYDAKRLFSNFSGLGNYSRSLLRQLSVQAPEHELHLYTPKVRINETTEHFQKHPFKVHHRKGKLGALWRSYGIKKDLRNDGIDIFHGLSHELPFGIHRTGIRTVVTVHDLIFKTNPETYPSIDLPTYELKTKYACRHADRIISISENTKKDIVRYYGVDPEKIDVVYQACDPIFYNDDFVESDLAIPPEFMLSVGTIKDRKNLKALYQARLLLDENLRIPLIVVGQARDKQAKKELLEAMKRDPGIIWLQEVENNLQLKALYQKAKVFVYPSIYEGFGLPVVEAMLCGTPVITSNTSSLQEAGGPHSLYLDPHDAKALADAIGKLLADPTKCEQMASFGRTWAQTQFDPSKCARYVLDIYGNM